MEVAAFCQSLLDALEDFDKSIPPLGLYASDDLVAGEQHAPHYQEWHRGLKPRLKQLGCREQRGLYRASNHLYNQEVRLEVQDIGSTHLKIVKISKIKVRKYGSQYRVDSHENYTERWNQLKIDKDLSNLWKVSALADQSVKLRIVLFVGFDKAKDPLAKELSQLQQSLNWDEHGVVYQTRTWQDRYERNFSVRLSAWARLA